MRVQGFANRVPGFKYKIEGFALGGQGAGFKSRFQALGFRVRACYTQAISNNLPDCRTNVEQKKRFRSRLLSTLGMILISGFSAGFKVQGFGFRVDLNQPI